MLPVHKEYYYLTLYYIIAYVAVYIFDFGFRISTDICLEKKLLGFVSFETRKCNRDMY